MANAQGAEGTSFSDKGRMAHSTAAAITQNVDIHIKYKQIN